MPNRVIAIEDQRRQRRREAHIRAHGISPQRFAEMYAAQGGRCGAPGCTRPAQVIDHDHLCHPGRYGCARCVRCLLCRSCNSRGVLDGAWRAEKRRALLDMLEAQDRVWRATHQLPPF